MTIELTGLEIAFMTFKQKRGVLQLAVRQKWPYYAKRHSHGSPIHIYPLDTLPPDIQVAWAQWDKDQYDNVCKAEAEKGESGRKDKVPPPVTIKQAREALQWPLRTTWEREDEEVKKGPPSSIYDEKSTGLCPHAQSALLKRFSDLKEWFEEIIREGAPSYVMSDEQLLQQKKLQAANPDRYNDLISFIERPAKICPNCDFAVFAKGYEKHHWCPLCRDKVKLIEHCPECGKKIGSPLYNRCPFCGEKLRTRAPLPPPE